MDGRIRKDGEAMMLLILDKNPYTAAMKVPKGIRHKQLLELMQMISCVVNFGYARIPTGKKLKEWIGKNKEWVLVYAKVLGNNLNLSKETVIKYNCLLDLLEESCRDIEGKMALIVPNLKTAVFRYVKEYEEFTEYSTNAELPIEIAIKEYEKYVEFKKDKWDKK